MITKKEVKHVAKLARLGLTEKETSKYQKELSAILDYFEKLKELDLTGEKKTKFSATLVENVTRQDAEISKLKAENLKLRELMPETKNSYLKVKSVLDQ